MRYGFILALALLIALGFSLRVAGAEEGEEPSGTSPGSFSVEWVLEAQSLEQLVDESHAIVQAEVVSISEGNPLVANPSTSGYTGDAEVDRNDSALISELLSSGAVLIPTEHVVFHVTDTIEGTLTGNFTLYKLGGQIPGGAADQSAHPPDDPAYAVGEGHLLFVERRRTDNLSAPNPDGTWLMSSPDGRFDIDASGELEAQSEGPVAAQVEGETPAEAEQQITEAAE